jgi:hypothetical protein
MKIRRSVQRLSAPAPVLFIGLAICFAYLMPANKLSSASAQAVAPNGSYGILLNQWKDANSNNVSALLGVLNFDGAGNVTGTYTLVTTKNPTAATGTWTGTYSGNPDGSNTVNLTFDVGGTITAAVMVTDGGNALQILLTGGSLLKPGQVVNGTGRIQSAQGTMPAGNYGYRGENSARRAKALRFVVRQGPQIPRCSPAFPAFSRSERRRQLQFSSAGWLPAGHVSDSAAARAHDTVRASHSRLSRNREV